MSVAFLDFFARISSACAYIHGSILLHALTDGLLVATSLTREHLLASLRLLRCAISPVVKYTHTHKKLDARVDLMVRSMSWTF